MIKTYFPKPTKKWHFKDNLKIVSESPLPNISSKLKPADTSKFDPLSKAAWGEAKFLIHIQDKRISDEERAVILAVGLRLFGARSLI